VWTGLQRPQYFILLIQTALLLGSYTAPRQGVQTACWSPGRTEGIRQGAGHPLSTPWWCGRCDPPYCYSCSC